MSNASSGTARPRVLICNCDKTMDLDGAALARHLAGDPATEDGTGQPGGLPVHTQLCRAGIASYNEALAGGEDLVVACTQEAPLFAELAEEAGHATPRFVNIRERAGWFEAEPGARSTASATPKIAALLADATYTPTPAETLTLTSNGVCLIYGKGQAALDTAEKLATRLNVTVLLTDDDGALPPATANVPVFKGQIVRASGTLGSFEVIVDGYAPAVPSSRAQLDFMMPRDGAASKCDIILDMTGGTPLFGEPDRHDGYFHVDPARPGAVAEAMFEASDLVGEFEKPLYVRYDASICAHGRSGKTGCTNCIDACPAGAISSAGESVAIDPLLCGGCGNCSAHCPTGAVSYAFPARDDLITRCQNLIARYTHAGGTAPVVLFHDDSHGGPLVSAMARYGRGLPVNVLPVAIYTATQIGHETIVALLASGAHHVAVLAPPARRGELASLEAEIDLVTAVLEGLGSPETDRRVHLLVESDPDVVESALHALAPAQHVAEGTFAASSAKREVARLALSRLHGAAPAEPGAPDIIALPESAPYGRITIRTDGCTMCLACVSCCPANALADNPDRPQVAFTEAACVQCGLCVSTCPENVIALEPRFNFSPSALSPDVLNEEEPFECVSCGKPFGTKSSVERVMEALAGKHAMFAGSDQSRVIQMCDDCRILAMDKTDRPMAMGDRPRVVTTEDYQKAEADGTAPSGTKPEDFIS